MQWRHRQGVGAFVAACERVVRSRLWKTCLRAGNSQFSGSALLLTQIAGLGMSFLTIEELADRVREHAEKKSVTQSEIADWIGVSQPVVSEALSGHPNQRKTLFRIAREFGFKVEDKPKYEVEPPSESP